jgi:hypothetical protein
MNRPTLTILLMLAKLLPTVALSLYGQPNQNLKRDCERQVSTKFKQWRAAIIRKDVRESAEMRNEDPSTVYGDFNSDNRRDVALLIEDGPSPAPEYPGRLDTLHIAICLSRTNQVHFHLIDKPYCGDGIALIRKGTPYHDYETEAEGVYENDGVSAYCTEVAGATYQFDGTNFVRVVDSD